MSASVRPPWPALAALDEAQAAAVVETAPRVLVVAGPGSGKTRVLTHRVAWLVDDQDVAPWRVLAITFTNRAAGEMRERIDTLVGPDRATGMWVGTFHSTCVRLLRRHGDKVGIDPGFSIADADDARRILKRLLAADGIDARTATKSADDLARRISSAKNRLEDPTRSPTTDLAHYATRYRDELAAQRLVDFDDLLVGAVRVLADPAVREQVTGRFTHVLVDEYQDTNVAQWRMLSHLAATGVCLFAVGDASQSIYGFRGSTPEAMEQFPVEYPGARVHHLGRNWRSTSRIVAVGDALGARTGVEHRARLWTEADQGAPVRIRSYRDDRQEAAAVADELKSASCPVQERAVLVRTHAQTRLVEAELAAAKVPYVIVGGTRFFDRAEVRDAMAWVRLAVNGDDVDAFRRAATTPRRGLGDKAIEAAIAMARARDVPITEVLDDLGQQPGRAAASYRSFAADLAPVIAATEQGPGPATDAALAVPGLIDAACRAAGRADTAVDREANLQELRSAAVGFTPDDDGEINAAPVTGFAATAAFCTQAALLSATDTDGEGVRISTVHAAKGREFDQVWVIGLEDGLFPHERADGAEIDEECRLLFVATTRARHRLTLTWATSRMVGGDVRERSPSPFLALLQPLVDTGDVDAVNGNAMAHPTPGWGQRRPSSTSRRLTAGRTVRRVPAAGTRWTTEAPSTAPAFTQQPPSRAKVPEGGYLVGQRVEHDSFGTGSVTSVNGDIVTVRFKDRTRTLSAPMAPMKPAPT